MDYGFITPIDVQNLSEFKIIHTTWNMEIFISKKRKCFFINYLKATNLVGS